MDRRDTRPVSDGGQRRDGDDEPTHGATGEQAEESDRTAIVEDLFDPIPYHQKLGVEVLVVTPRRAETKLPFDESLVGNPDLGVLHGGTISMLADLTGAAIFIGHEGDYTPTVDLRVDYLEAAGKQPLYATATIDRHGRNIGVASIELESGDTVCATARGVYKLSND